MKLYLLYVLRAITLGAGLNIALTSALMFSAGWSYLQSVPLAAAISINSSFLADRILFKRLSKRKVS